MSDGVTLVEIRLQCRSRGCSWTDELGAWRLVWCVPRVERRVGCGGHARPFSYAGEVCRGFLRRWAGVAPRVLRQVVLTKLNGYLAKVCKNPARPRYNHYLFESIAVLVQQSLKADPRMATTMEEALFPPFQQASVLRSDVQLPTAEQRGVIDSPVSLSRPPSYSLAMAAIEFLVLVSCPHCFL